MNDRTQRRRGLSSVAALIALMIIALICAAIFKVGLARRSDLNAAERSLQADWLAESGLDRAASRLLRAPDYPGETWEMPSDALGGRGPGRVVLRAEAEPGHPGRRRVEARAEYPVGAPDPARRTKAISIEIPQEPR